MGKIRGAHTSPGIYFKIDDQEYNVQSRNNRSSLLKSSSSSGGGGGGVKPSPSKSYPITINGLSDDVRVTVNGMPYSPKTKYKYGSSVTIFAEIIDKPQYHFEGYGDTWEIVMTITENNTVTLPKIVKDTYTITFENWDGTPLQTSEVEYGEFPVYSGETPTRPSDVEYIYTFSGWTPEICPVTDDAVYTTVFTETLRSYPISISGLSDNVHVTVNGVPYSAETEYEYGSSVTIFAEIVDRPQYHFENSGDTWETEITITDNNVVTLPNIVKDTYTITFENWDGTPLQKNEVEYGEMPVYRGETPTRPSDAQYIYTFSGWAPEIVAVTCNKTYTATYSHKEAPALTYWGEVNTEDLDALGTSFRLGDLQLILSGTSDPAGIEGEELVIGGTGKTKEYVYNVTEDDAKAYNLWNDEEITDEEYNEYLTGHSKYFIYVVPNEYSNVTITEASQTSILVPYSIEKDYTIDDVEYAIIKIKHQPDTKFQIDDTYWSCRESLSAGDQKPVIKQLIIKINS